MTLKHINAKLGSNGTCATTQPRNGEKNVDRFCCLFLYSILEWVHGFSFVISRSWFTQHWFLFFSCIFLHSIDFIQLKIAVEYLFFVCTKKKTHFRLCSPLHCCSINATFSLNCHFFFCYLLSHPTKLIVSHYVYLNYGIT